MGQRHQGFFIARLIARGGTKPRYRSIAAVHHQWCYGSLPLRAADRLITLVKNPVNSFMIREELNALERLTDEEETDVPCPFSAFLLASAFNVAIDESYTAGRSLENCLLSAQMSCWGGDNNDGLTIIDVTDPTNPAYAFVLGSETDADLGDEPVTAEDYLRAYYEEIGPDGSDNDKNADAVRKELITRFDSVPFLTEDLLGEAWPEEFGPNKRKEYRRTPQRKSIPKMIAVPVEEPAKTVPSLIDLAIEPAVVQSIETGDSTAIELLIPSKVARIKTALRSRKPFPDAGVPLLIAAIQQEAKHTHTLDLSGYSLSTDQLTSIVSKVPEVRIVNLSHMPDLQVDHLRALLTTKPEIDRLELLDTGITREALRGLLNSEPTLFKRTSDILHPLFTLVVYNTKGVFNIFIKANGLYGNCIALSSIPIWSPAKLIQNLVDLLTCARADRQLSYESMLVQTVMSTGLRDPNVEWKNRSVSMITGSVRAVKDDTWNFVLEEARTDGWSPRRPDLKMKYAFVKTLAKEDVRAYDVEGFLAEMEKEGRGPLPSKEMVQKFENLIKGVERQAEEENNQESSAAPLVARIFSMISRQLNQEEQTETETETEDDGIVFKDEGAKKFLGSVFQQKESGGLRVVAN